MDLLAGLSTHEQLLDFCDRVDRQSSHPLHQLLVLQVQFDVLIGLPQQVHDAQHHYDSSAAHVSNYWIDNSDWAASTVSHQPY